MSDESSLHPPNEELEQRAQQFAERARQLLEELQGTDGNIAFKSITALHYFLQSQSCYAELTRRRAIERAERDKQEAEDRANRDRGRENRHFWLEIGLTSFIIVLIGWEIDEGRQQAALLRQMNKNTADTALQIQRAADATTASLEILRQERAEREKTPRLALYVGNLPIDKATVRLAGRPEYPQVTASFDLLVKNVGDAPLSTSRLHALLPEEIGLNGASYDSSQAYRPQYIGGGGHSSFGGTSQPPDHSKPWRPPLAGDLFRDPAHAFGHIGSGIRSCLTSSPICASPQTAEASKKNWSSCRRKRTATLNARANSRR